VAHEKEEEEICFLCWVQKTKKESPRQQVKQIRTKKALDVLLRGRRKKEKRKNQEEKVT
jgi:hypothetical protein